MTAANSSAKGTASPIFDLVRKQSRKFMSVLPRVLGEEDPEAVHDLRVASRRIQQALDTIFPKPRPAAVQKIVGTMRRARRAVGGWRDADVIIGLLHRITRRVKGADERRAWEAVEAVIMQRRIGEIDRARRKLARRRLFTLGQDVKKLLDASSQNHASADGIGAAHPEAILSQSIAGAWAQWQALLTHGRETRDAAAAHAFRIQSKRLRYRIELAGHLGAPGAGSALKFLKWIQDQLGAMHDRGECARIAAEAMAISGILTSDPAASSLALKRLAREHARLQVETSKILDSVEERRVQLESWIEQYCAPHQPS
jgi:CHAD domain-containing protein